MHKIDLLTCKPVKVQTKRFFLYGTQNNSHHRVTEKRGTMAFQLLVKGAQWCWCFHNMASSSYISDYPVFDLQGPLGSSGTGLNKAFSCCTQIEEQPPSLHQGHPHSESKGMSNQLYSLSVCMHVCCFTPFCLVILIICRGVAILEDTEVMSSEFFSGNWGVLDTRGEFTFNT